MMDGSASGSRGPQFQDPRTEGAGASVSEEGTLELLQSILSDLVNLVRANLRMAALESAASARSLMMAVALGVVGLLLSGVLLNVLAAAAIAGFAAAGHPIWVAALLVGAIVLMAIVIAVASAAYLGRSANLLPRKAMRRMGQDLSAIVGATHHDDH